MDTSDTYILMCTKATEIQAYKQPKPNKIYLCKSQMGKISHDLEGGVFYGQPTQEIVHPFVVPMPLAIWLPRQDDLQKMVAGDWVKTFGEFVFWVERDDNSGVDEFNFENTHGYDSMEQLWLAFVMHVKYHKTWNGKDFVCQ